MGSVHQFTKFKRLVLSITLAVFSLSIIPMPLVEAAQNAVNLNDAGFALRIEKLDEKINRY